MRTSEYAEGIVRELHRCVAMIPDDNAESLVEAILRAHKIFTAGAGRTGLMGRAFAMRLMQMGFEAFVVGETVTPAIEQSDLLVIGSGSGETRSLIVMADKAHTIKAKLAAVTLFPESSIGKAADMVVQLPGSSKDESNETRQSIQPMGALFEQTLLLFYDAVVLRLMEKKDLTSVTMFGRHANLE